MKLFSFYRFFLDEEKAPCTNSQAQVCDVAPKNFFLMLASLFFNKLSDVLSNAKTVLPWMMQSMGAPLYLIGLLVPIRESGSMLPQLFIADAIKRLRIKKWVWTAGALVQSIVMVLMLVVVFTQQGVLGGWLIVVLLVIFSFARAFSSIVSKDVMGKTIPKQRRGKLNGFAASGAGLVAISVGFWLVFSPENARLYGALLVAASVSWILSGIIYAAIKEFPSEQKPQKKQSEFFWHKTRRLWRKKQFKTFLIARTLFLCSVLSAPYYVALAQGVNGSTAVLGMFVLASGVAGALSGPFWGKLADISSKKVMITGAFFAALLGAVIFLSTTFSLPFLATTWAMPLFFFLLSVAHEGIRLGRKTYIVDMAEGGERTDYVAVGNTLIGVVLLAFGLLSVLFQEIGPSGAIGILSLTGFVGVGVALALPEVSKKPF
jgi:MFS family permease